VDGVAKLLRDELLLDRDVSDHRHVTWLYGENAALPGAGGRAVPAEPAARAQDRTDGQRQREKESAP
jgi:hypothetical protein